MLSNDPRFRVLIVDGQRLLFPDESAWNDLENGAELDGRIVITESFRKWYVGERAFVKVQPNLEFALYKPGRSSGWLGIVLVDLDGVLQRVHLERLTCESCGWVGMSGNPWLVDLYLGSPEKDEAQQRGWDLELLGCPRCGGELPRASVWTEPLLETSNLGEDD